MQGLSTVCLAFGCVLKVNYWREKKGRCSFLISPHSRARQMNISSTLKKTLFIIFPTAYSFLNWRLKRRTCMNTMRSPNVQAE